MTALAGAYCSLDDVRARTRQRLRSSDTPSAATVEEWILNGAYRINGELYLFHPPFRTTAALRIIKPLNIDYAASRVYGALQNEPQANRLDNRFEEIIEKIRKREISLGLPAQSRFRGGGPAPDVSLPPDYDDIPDTGDSVGDLLGLPETGELLGLPA